MTYNNNNNNILYLVFMCNTENLLALDWATDNRGESFLLCMIKVMVKIRKTTQSVFRPKQFFPNRFLCVLN